MIVRDYVRTGKVQIVFSGMHFVGPDSETALRTALAAAAQGRFWNVLELLYENQGTENTGWVTDSLLRSIGDAVPGLSTSRMLDGGNRPRSSGCWRRATRSHSRRASTRRRPSRSGGRDGQPSDRAISSLGATGLEPALDAALQG